MSDTRIDFLYLNEKDMIDAGVWMPGIVWRRWKKYFVFWQKATF